MGGDVIGHFGKRAHRFIQPFFTLLLLIGCFSASTPSVANEVPASGGYYAPASQVGPFESGEVGPFESEIEARSILLAYLQSPTFTYCTSSWPELDCHDDYAIPSTGTLVQGSFYNYSWTWYLLFNGQHRVRQFVGGTFDWAITTPGHIEVTAGVLVYEIMLAGGGAVTLNYTCPSGYRMVGDPLTWQPGSPRPTCTDGLVCPVADLTPIPADDACAQTLDAYNSTQEQKTAACGTLTPAMQTAVGCFGDKLGAINNPATGQPIPLRITADIRNLAYQAHLREVWDRMEDLVRKTRRNPAVQAACVTRRAKIAAEKGCDNAGPCLPCAAPTATARRHCLASRPARPNPNDATHPQGKAIDVDRVQTIDPLQSALSQRTPPQSIQGMLDAPTNCKLDYLGAGDPVHFQLRP
jgi:hypothetical protein